MVCGRVAGEGGGLGSLGESETRLNERAGPVREGERVTACTKTSPLRIHGIHLEQVQWGGGGLGGGGLGPSKLARSRTRIGVFPPCGKKGNSGYKLA